MNYLRTLGSPIKQYNNRFLHYKTRLTTTKYLFLHNNNNNNNSSTLLCRRMIHQQKQNSNNNKKDSNSSNSNVSAGMYTAAIFIGMLGLSYAAVPLYRLFCASTGYSGTVQTDRSKFSPDRLTPVIDPNDNNNNSNKRRIRITFESNTSDALPWSFKPELRELYVVPGETALTFYKAKSNAKEDVVGIATYNVTPYRAGSYFNKIQCFCFEEQRLSPGEDVDMPVFFFIDPDFINDPYMKDVNTITLGYTLFNAKHAPHLAPIAPTLQQQPQQQQD